MIAGARHWKPTQLPELYRDDIHDPDQMQRMADEQMSAEEFANGGFIVASDPGEHVNGYGRSSRSAGASSACS